MRLPVINSRKSSEQPIIHLWHVRQLHGHPLPEIHLRTPDSLKSVIVESQRKVIEYILENRCDFILSEGLVEPLTLEVIKRTDVDEIRGAFPSGFLKNSAALNIVQRNCLYKYNAGMVVVALGLVEKIYLTTNEDQNTKVRATLEFSKMKL